MSVQPKHKKVHSKPKPKGPLIATSITPKARHYYTFSASNGLSVTMLRGDGAPKLSSGGARWEVTNVPRRVGFTQWQGRDPFVLDVPILFEGHYRRLKPFRSIEDEARTLNQMHLSAEFQRPPTIKIDGALPISDRRWVIQDITWGDEVFWVQDGPDSLPYRTRQDAVVHFLEYNAEDRVKVLATNTLPNWYIVKKGQTTTLRMIAKEMYGDANQWKKIKKANPAIRDQNHIKGPKRVRIP
jgi:hypothetical protein